MKCHINQIIHIYGLIFMKIRQREVDFSNYNILNLNALEPSVGNDFIV